MLIAGLTIFMTCISSPILMLSSTVAKLRYSLRGVKQLETSKESVLREVDLFVKESNNVFRSLWLFNNTVHVLCRYATIFSDRSPIVILANTCSFEYVEFMRNIPRIYDVYCIDLPTSGLNPISQRVNSSVLFCETHLASIILSLSHSSSTKFTIVGESYGVTLITRAITSDAIKLNRVNELILINLPKLSYKYLATKFKICFSRFILKSAWAPWLFSAFLYPRKDVLSRIRTAFKFMLDKEQPNMASEWASGFDLKDLFYLSGKLKITLVEDTVTGAMYSTFLRQRSGNAIKSNSYTLNPLDNRNTRKSVVEFTNLID
jgi:pimeloyl-ACP methyl ester carboxylesterase